MLLRCGRYSGVERFIPRSQFALGSALVRSVLLGDLALPNTAAGHRSLLTHLRRWQAKTGRPTHVVSEGTGGYERAVVRALLSASIEVNARVECLTRVADVGVVSAYSLRAHLPELGKLSRGAVAALAGVAPMNADSGPMRGQRHIRGGRAPAPKALYLAAFCATLHNPLLKAFYKALRGRGKPAKVALTAVMRKLLIHLNSRLKTPLQISA